MFSTSMVVGPLDCESTVLITLLLGRYYTKKISFLARSYDEYLASHYSAAPPPPSPLAPGWARTGDILPDTTMPGSSLVAEHPAPTAQQRVCPALVVSHEKLPDAFFFFK